MFARQMLVAFFASALGLSASAGPDRAPADGHARYFTPSPSIDDGLGELPPFDTWTDPWVYAQPGERIDNGLGQLPPFREWRYAWVYSIPAEKIDSGLGDLPPYSEWRYAWRYSIPAEKLDSGLGEMRSITLSTGSHRIH